MTEKRAAPCAAWAIVLSMSAYQILEYNQLIFQQENFHLLRVGNLLWGGLGLVHLAASAVAAFIWLHRLEIDLPRNRRLAEAALLLLFLFYSGIYTYKLAARVLPGNPSGLRLEELVAPYTGGAPQVDRDYIASPSEANIPCGGRAWEIIKDWKVQTYVFRPLRDESRGTVNGLHIRFTQPRYGTAFSLDFRSPGADLAYIRIDNNHSYDVPDEEGAYYYIEIPDGDFEALAELRREVLSNPTVG